MNDGGGIGKVFPEIYPAELELKVKHNGSHESFIDLDISIDKGKFNYKTKGASLTFVLLESYQLQVIYHSLFFYYVRICNNR